MKTHRPVSLLLVSLLSVAALAACDRNSDETVGQTMDRSVEEASQRTQQATAQVEDRATQARQEANQATSDATQAIQQGAREAGNVVDDAAITASVKADLVRDPELSALGINVDTSRGEVTLRGQADTAAAKERATTIATSVKGVAKVHNELTVKEKS